MRINVNSPFRKKNQPTSYRARPRLLHFIIDRVFDPCLRCPALVIKTGRVFTLHCVEGRLVSFRICRSCARIPDFQITNDVELGRAA
jgi:hypothetical protein